MKLLFVYYKDSYSTKEFGGYQVTMRNKYFLEKIFGFQNIEVYGISGYKNKIIQIAYSFFGLSNGVSFSTINYFKSIIRKNSFDYLFLDSSKFGRLLDYSMKIPNRIVFFHNIELNFIREAVGNSFLKRVLYTTIFSSIQRNENNSIVKANQLITLNERDSDQLRICYNKLNRTADFILPITFTDCLSLEKSTNIDKDIDMLFVGSNFYGNTDGLFWFIDNCMPYINATLFIVGNGMEKFQKKSTSKVQFVGYVQDLSTYYYRAKCIVLPIISGSGMKTKTCEALMYGKYIFGSQEAFEGYEITDYSEVGGLCETCNDYIMQINDFLTKRKNFFSENNRKIYNDKYNTINVLTSFKNYIHQLSTEDFLQNEK